MSSTRHRPTNRSTSARFSELRREFSAPYRSSPITGTGRINSLAGGDKRAPAWPARTAIATLVSRTTLLPLTKIDALEFALHDRAHLLSIVRRDATSEIGERSRVFFRRDGERHAPMLRDALGPSERPEDPVLVHRFEPRPHRSILPHALFLPQAIPPPPRTPIS